LIFKAFQTNPNFCIPKALTCPNFHPFILCKPVLLNRHLSPGKSVTCLLLYQPRKTQAESCHPFSPSHPLQRLILVRFLPPFMSSPSSPWQFARLPQSPFKGKDYFLCNGLIPNDTIHFLEFLTPQTVPSPVPCLGKSRPANHQF